MDELYDLETDPDEERNLIDAPAARATLARMQAELRPLSRGPNAIGNR